MFAKEGYSNIAVALLLSVLLCIAGTAFAGWLSWLFYAAAAVLTLFILYFFRDPDRNLPDDDSLIIAPADGNIVSITEVDEPLYIEGRARQISIFLSPLDVHVNRVPASGKIEYLKYHPGKYLMAWDERASSMNERADFGLLHQSNTKLLFRQITGFMARRIVYHLNEGDQVRLGERFGMMKFGSRMDILVPIEAKVEVEEGDRTVGGETIVGRFNES